MAARYPREPGSDDARAASCLATLPGRGSRSTAALGRATPVFSSPALRQDRRQPPPGLQRTLRRQAQSFLEKPFVNREARLFNYAMNPAERALYDDVTRYLLEPGIQAFQGKHRQLLLLGFHRRLASSTRALAASAAPRRWIASASPATRASHRSSRPRSAAPQASSSRCRRERGRLQAASTMWPRRWAGRSRLYAVPTSNPQAFNVRAHVKDAARRVGARSVDIAIAAGHQIRRVVDAPPRSRRAGRRCRTTIRSPQNQKARSTI